MKPYFAVTSEQIQKTYDVHTFPTVILLVNGQERQRWVLDYDLDHYRSALNEVLAAETPQPGNKPSR